ncbi:MAG: hypothetical protein PHW24_02685 [Candidatus Moranbacteria bacterium]|nr:hypothetical protein [Candidatus Moranbacteria bacterium]
MAYQQVVNEIDNRIKDLTEELGKLSSWRIFRKRTLQNLIERNKRHKDKFIEEVKTDQALGKKCWDEFIPVDSVRTLSIPDGCYFGKSNEYEND